MNLANELDLELDNAIKRHLGRIFDAYFQGTGDATQMQNDIKQLESSVEAATKALEEML